MVGRGTSLKAAKNTGKEEAPTPNKRNADGKICIFILFVEYELESRKEIENPVNPEIFGRARWKSGCRR